MLLISCFNLLSLFLIVDIKNFASCSDAPTTPTNDSGSSNDPIASQVYQIKQPHMWCRGLMDIFDNRNLEYLNNAVRSCETYYNNIILRTIDDLGLVGQAITIWLNILNDFLMHRPDRFDMIAISSVDLIPDLYPLLDATLEPPEGQEASDIFTNNIQREYLVDAYLYGQGICVHINTGPLRSILDDIISMSLHYEMMNLEFGSGNHPFTFIHELRIIPRMGRLSMLYLIQSLNWVCRNLKSRHFGSDINEIVRLKGEQAGNTEVIRAVYNDQLLLDLMFQANLIVPQRLDVGICNHGFINRFQRSLNIFLESSPLINFFTSRTEMINEHFFKNCLARLTNRLFSNQVDILPPDIETYSFSLAARKYINDIYYSYGFGYELPVSHVLDTRNFPDISDADRMFFTIHEIDPIIDQQDALAAYRDGLSGPCAFYASNSAQIYRSDNALFRLLELYNSFSQKLTYLPQIDDQSSGFFFMWRMCQMNRIFPLSGDSSSSNNQDNNGTPPVPDLNLVQET